MWANVLLSAPFMFGMKSRMLSFLDCVSVCVCVCIHFMADSRFLFSHSVCNSMQCFLFMGLAGGSLASSVSIMNFSFSIPSHLVSCISQSYKLIIYFIDETSLQFKLFSSFLSFFKSFS